MTTKHFQISVPSGKSVRVIHNKDYIGQIVRSTAPKPYLARSIYGPTQPFKEKRNAVAWLLDIHSKEDKDPKESVTYHIIETVDSHYCIVKVVRYKDHIGSRLVSEHDRLIVAQQQKALLEDGVPSTSAGGGNIAAIGIGPQGEPGVDLRKKKKTPLMQLLRRYLKGPQ